MAAGFGIVLYALTSVLQAQRPSPPFETLVATYRAGNVDAALAELDRLLRADKAQAEFDRWRLWARSHNDWAKMEAMLLACTEGMLKAFQSDAPFIPQLAFPYKAPMLQLHNMLKERDARSPFLRAWYLVWESALQAVSGEIKTRDLDLLDDALAAFPDDAQILLAAGSRYELAWWDAADSSHRNPRGALGRSQTSLETARFYLRRSAKANPPEAEARVRLAHVLLELGDAREGLDTIATFDWSKARGGLDYLAALLEGALLERLGDTSGADAAYDRAISLADVPQAARVAKAKLAHSTGRRAEAAAEVSKAMSLPRNQADPWWVFIQGQSWRRDGYLAIARGLVQTK